MKDSQRLSLLYLYANLLDYKIKIFPTDKFPKHDLEELEQNDFHMAARSSGCFDIPRPPLPCFHLCCATLHEYNL